MSGKYCRRCDEGTERLVGVEVQNQMRSMKDTPLCTTQSMLSSLVFAFRLIDHSYNGSDAPEH